MAREREARDWTQADAVAAMRLHATKQLPEDSSLIRQWKRWEAGEVTPSDFYQPIIAATFGTVTHALFPKPGRRNGNAEILTISAMEPWISSTASRPPIAMTPRSTHSA